MKCESVKNPSEKKKPGQVGRKNTIKRERKKFAGRRTQKNHHMWALGRSWPPGGGQVGLNLDGGRTKATGPNRPQMRSKNW